MSFVRYAAMAAGGLLISATAALAGPTYTFATSEGVQPSNVGTITLTQVNSTTVDVFVDLADTTLPLPQYGFLNTGGPHTPFAFTLAGTETGVSANFILPPGGSYAFGLFSLSTADGGATPYGTFGISINSTAGNGSSNAYFGDLKFDVTRASGLSTDDFILNSALDTGSSGPAFFAADLTDGGSNTGSQAWKIRTAPTPCPSRPASQCSASRSVVSASPLAGDVPPNTKRYCALGPITWHTTTTPTPVVPGVGTTANLGSVS